MGALTLWIVLACARPGPTEQALQRYDEGRAAVQRGDWAAAVLAFEAAAALQPDSPSLCSWRVYALAHDGRDKEALALADEGVLRWPRALDLRYNRAALRARLGMDALAADDLRLLYQTGEVDPYATREDPDFANLIANPAFADVVPEPPLEATIQGPKGAVLRGERFEVQLEVTHPKGVALQVGTDERSPSLLALERVVEDQSEVDARTLRTRLEWTFRTREAGQGTLGPFEILAGARAARLDAVPVLVSALGSAPSTAPTEDITLWVPSAIVGGRVPPRAFRTPQGTPVLLAAPGAKARLLEDGEPVSLVPLELRRDGQPVWQAFVPRTPQDPAAGRIEAEVDLVPLRFDAAPDPAPQTE